MKKIYSFDIFDTLLTRCYSRPTDLFYSVGHELNKRNIAKMPSETWVQLRISAESEARISANSDEITLAEIYTLICQKLNISEKLREKMEQIEIEQELSSLKGIKPHVNKLKSLRKEGHKVIFISDMYLPSEVIKKALIANNIECHDDELFVSSDYRETKYTGKLFLRVLAHFNISPAELTHTGDNIISDYRMPKSLGINAVHYSSFDAPGRDNLISNCEQLPFSFRSHLASIIRLSRLNGTYHDLRDTHIHHISSTVIAPILFGFTLWTLLEAKKKGLKTLYFISRDGQILKQIADRINTALQLQIECKYFYGSRQAFHLPAVTEDNWDHLDWLYDDTSFFSVKLIFNRVGLKPDAIKQYLLKNGFEPSAWNNNLNADERAKLRHILHRSPEFKTLVLESAAVARHTLVSYLNQEGIHAGARIAFVDIGWNGRLQRSLSRVMDIAGIKPAGGLMGFYFGLRQRLKASAEDNLFAWYYDEENELKRFNNVVILEKFVEATHGSVIGYKKENDRIEPVLKEEKNREALDWGLEVQQASILSFTDLLCSVIPNIDKQDLNNSDNWTTITEILLTDFCIKPSPLDARIFGSVAISEDQNHARSYPLAKPLTFKNCISLLMRKKPNVYNDLWIHGSLHLTRGGKLVSSCLQIQSTVIGFIKSRLSE